MTGRYARFAGVTRRDSGIGPATATLLATEGFDVGLTFHTDEEGVRRTAKAVEERGQRAFVRQLDAESPEAGEVVDELSEELGGLGVLVNVAGTGHRDRVVDLDL